MIYTSIIYFTSKFKNSVYYVRRRKTKTKKVEKNMKIFYVSKEEVYD